VRTSSIRQHDIALHQFREQQSINTGRSVVNPPNSGFSLKDLAQYRGPEYVSRIPIISEEPKEHLDATWRAGVLARRGDRGELNNRIDLSQRG
jgi:hypothetical protein